MPNTVFALDIGTRTVTGILLEMEENTYHVLDFFEEEHTERSMRDGQIHHVIAVAKVIKKVKHKLEERNNITLHKACVAAAGRSLITTRAKASIPLNNQPITKQEQIKHLELLAVQEAQYHLVQEAKDSAARHYCVGYSVLHYQLDEQTIGSLIDQQGLEASAHIIATFLPKVVVESLLSALQRAELEMEALTLEPIAAIQVLIPESMRRLNVALVDIGAGTSDIALTDQGTVIAYGMVSVAGDQITEAISDNYLLDFPKAENMKRQIVQEKKAQVEDILGFETIISYNQFIDDISISIDQLADNITKEILKLNEKSPRAVMLVGGGSLTPELPKVIASKLDLPENRVAVRGIEAIASLQKNEHTPKGPAFVTPIGIAIAAKQNPVHYVTVTVNGSRIRMFEMKKLTVGDCIIQSGLETNQLYGKPGKGYIIKVNGTEMTIPGTLGSSPTIYVNGLLSTIDTYIQNEDIIEVSEGASGESPNIKLQEIIESPKLRFYYEGKPVTQTTQIFVNGIVRQRDYIIQDQDRIEWRNHFTIEDFIEQQSIETRISFFVYVNNQKHPLPEAETMILVNGKNVPSNTSLKSQDKLEITTKDVPVVSDLLTQLDISTERDCTITFNGEMVVLKQPLATLYRNDEKLDSHTALNHGDKLILQKLTPEPLIFQDVFRFTSIDMQELNAGFKLYRNSQPTSFDEPIQPGDQLEIK